MNLELAFVFLPHDIFDLFIIKVEKISEKEGMGYTVCKPNKKEKL